MAPGPSSSRSHSTSSSSSRRSSSNDTREVPSAGDGGEQSRPEEAQKIIRSFTKNNALGNSGGTQPSTWKQPYWRS